eukprot:1332333-Prymnesium_polylepis.1
MGTRAGPWRGVGRAGGRCGSSRSLLQTSGSRRLGRQTGKWSARATSCEAAAARRSARGGAR